MIDNNVKICTYFVNESIDGMYCVEQTIMKAVDEFEFYASVKEKNKHLQYDMKYRYYKMNKHELKKFTKELFTAVNSEGNFLMNVDADDLNIDLMNYYFSINYFRYGQSSLNNVALKKLNRLALEFDTMYSEIIYSIGDRLVEWSDQFNSSIVEHDRLFVNTDKIEKVTCFNVGQANMSYGYCSFRDDEPRAIFDLGERCWNKAYIKNQTSKINGNSVIIISHYDADHINAFKYLKNSAKNSLWILPEPTYAQNNTKTARNFLMFLNYANCIFLKNRDYRLKSFNCVDDIFKILNVEIVRGNCVKLDPNQSSNENARSLICHIENQKSMLLPADALYLEYQRNYTVDYLVVPHHCCNYNDHIQNVALNFDAELIVCSGSTRSYRHPNMTHLAKLVYSKNGKFDHVIFLQQRGCIYNGCSNQSYNILGFQNLLEYTVHL